MSLLLGWVIFVAALLFSVMLHESGHFFTAKKFHMKVTQFFVGFGQTLWSTTKGETEYGIKVLPLGGFVKITGMTALEDVDPADEARSFREQPGWQRIIVLAAGSFMHFALAFFLLIVLALGVGLANDNSTQIGAVGSCIPASAAALDSGSCQHSLGVAPARQAGIRAGDKIIAIAGTPVRTWTQLGAAIRAQPGGKPVAITVLRGGRQLVLHASPAVVPGRSGSYLGIGSAELFQRLNPLRAVSYAGSTFGQVMVGSVTAVGHLPAAIPDLFAKYPGRPGIQRRRRRRAHRPGGGRQGRLADEGADRPADHHLAEHLRRRLQPATAAPAGRRAPGSGDLRAGAGVAGQAARAARPGAGGHA